jgi:hypothetical protein
MAPETLYQGESLKYTVDYFSIGMLLHEILFGFVPNQGDDINEVKKFFASNNLKVNKEQAKMISKDCVDFMNKLFHKKNKKRLGYNGGIDKLKYHSWFNDFKWLQLERKELKAPFVPPSTKDNFNTKLNKERYAKQIMKSKQDSTSKNAVVTQHYKNYTFIGTLNDNDEKESEYKLQDNNDVDTSNNIKEVSESESENLQRSVNSSDCLSEKSEGNENDSRSISQSKNDKIRETEGSNTQQYSSNLSDSSQSKESEYIRKKKRKFNNPKKKFISSLNHKTKSLILSSPTDSSKVLTRNYYQMNEYFPENNNKHRKFMNRRESKSSQQTMLNMYEQNKSNIFRQRPHHVDLDSPTNYNRYSRDVHKTNTSLPKIISPQRHSYLVSIKEETPININYHKNSLSNSKFFNYKLENHIQDKESESLSPFKYVANQIQSARQYYKLNRHKTVRNSGQVFSSFDTTKNDSETNNNKYNQDNSLAEPYNIIRRNKSYQSVTSLRPNRRKSFFDFTLGMN